MSDHIENAGKKGYCMMYIFLAFATFFAVWAYVYWSNFDLTF